MRQRLCHTIIGLGMLFGLSGTALADFIYTLDTANFAIPAPYGTATVHLINSTHASVTFVSNNTTAMYFFADGGAVGVNVNASAWTASATGDCTSCNPLTGIGSGNEDGFGSFNQRFTAGTGNPGDRSHVITVLLTNTGGTWANDMVVLINNASGDAVAAHIFNCPAGITGECLTGFATSDAGGREQQIPEPGMLGLLALGMMASGVVITRRRRV